MSIPVEIKNGTGLDITARVGEENDLLVSVAPMPPGNIRQRMRPFTQFFVDENDSFDMSNAVGSLASPVNYKIEADASAKYICEINFVIGYGGIGYLYNFADSTALTNGIRFYYKSAEGEVDFENIVKTNTDLIRLRRDPFNSNWQARNFAAVNDYGYIGTIDLRFFMPPYGIKLDEGTDQEMVIAIRDDISGPVDVLNFFARGFERV